MGYSNRLSYDTVASADVQNDVTGIVGRLESLIDLRNQQVNGALADFRADGVSDDYAGLEQRWRSAADEVRAIITLIKQVLGRNDDTAAGALASARNALLAV